MPRAKIPMIHISNARQRARTFSRRKEGLMKKARELATLCGVDVAVVCASPDGGGGAPGVWESKEGVIQRYRALPPEKRKEHTHLDYVKEEDPGKEEAKVLARAPWSEAAALDGIMSQEELLGSIDAALIATAERRKVGLPEDDGDRLRRVASDALAPCSGYGPDNMYGGWGEELMRDGVQPLPVINAEDVTQPAPGVQYINGDMGGNQFLQLQMPMSNGNNNNLRQFAWDAYQPNITAHPGGYGHQFTDGNYVDMGCPQMQLVLANLNAEHSDWPSPGMWGAGESSGHAFAPGSSAYRPAEHCAPGVGDNFTGAPGIAMGSNFVDANGNEYKTQCLADDPQDPYTTQDLGLHYPSDRVDGLQFRP